MQTNTNRKRSVESFIVTKRGQTIYAPSTATHLNANTGAVVLNDGQAGWFSVTGANANKSIVTADTAATAPVIALYQGTGSSATPWLQQYAAPLVNRVYERTADIDSKYNVIATKFFSTVRRQVRINATFRS